MTVSTITELAISYADKDAAAIRAHGKLTEHADWAGYVARVVKGNASELAREILGMTYVPSKDVHKDAVDFRRMETIATALRRATVPADPTPVLRVSIYGGKTVDVPADFNGTHADLLALTVKAPK